MSWTRRPEAQKLFVLPRIELGLDTGLELCRAEGRTDSPLFSEVTDKGRGGVKQA